MISRFEELLNELGMELGLSLHQDRIGACTLNIQDTFRVQLSTDTPMEHLLIATMICDVPPGKYRENILKDALKSNAPFPLNGTLAYSDKNNMLALFAFLPLASLNGHKIAEFLPGFIDKAKKWRSGIETGHTATLIPSTAKPSGNPFGLKP